MILKFIKKQKIIILFVFLLPMLAGCSLLPRIKFGTPGTVPQQINKSKAKGVCKGEAKFNEQGEMTYCSKGYYKYTEGYDKKERKMTIVERIKGFINDLVGWSFWIFVALLFLAPGLLGTIAGRLIEGTIGITGKSLRAIVRGVQRTRTTGKDLNDSLDAEEDSDVKDYIAKLKKKEKIK